MTTEGEAVKSEGWLTVMWRVMLPAYSAGELVSAYCRFQEESKTTTGCAECLMARGASRGPGPHTRYRGGATLWSRFHRDGQILARSPSQRQR